MIGPIVGFAIGGLLCLYANRIYPHRQNLLVRGTLMVLGLAFLVIAILIALSAHSHH